MSFVVALLGFVIQVVALFVDLLLGFEMRVVVLLLYRSVSALQLLVNHRWVNPSLLS